MANTTVRGAVSIHGTNPQFLIEKVIRARVYDSGYWKEHCFALNAASLIDNCISDVRYVGGTYANQRPTEFMCLALKLLQLQPEREIIMEYLRAEEFKYLRALAAFYVRLTFPSVNVYEILEPLLDDYRKIRLRRIDGSYTLTTIDQFADDLLNEERVCDVQLPRLTQRKVVEVVEGLPPRRSKLAKAMGVAGDGDEDGEGADDRSERYVSRSPSVASGDRSRSASPERYVSRSPSPERYVSRSPSPERYMSRSPSGSPVDMDDERIEGDV